MPSRKCDNSDFRLCLVWLLPSSQWLRGNLRFLYGPGLCILLYYGMENKERTKIEQKKRDEEKKNGPRNGRNRQQNTTNPNNFNQYIQVFVYVMIKYICDHNSYPRNG